MFVCWKKFCYAALTAKTFVKFAPFFGPQNGGWKMDPKMVPELTTQMRSKHGTQKGGPTPLWPKKDLQEIKALFKILGPPFGCHFWTPFWASNSGTIFGSIFQPPFSGPKMVQILQKFLLSKLHSKIFSSKQTCKSKCICNHFPANCIFEHNSIIHLVKPSKITTSFDCHKCCMD